MRAGVRCADTTPTSNGTSNSASAVTASSITDQSLSLPMMTPTLGVLAMSVPSIRPLAVRQVVRGPRRTLPDVRNVFVVGRRTVGRTEHVHVPDLAPRPLGLAVQVHLGIGDPREQM